MRTRKVNRPTLREELWPIVRDLCGRREDGTYCTHPSEMQLPDQIVYCLDESCPILPLVEKLVVKLVVKYGRKP